MGKEIFTLIDFEGYYQNLQNLDGDNGLFVESLLERTEDKLSGDLLKGFAVLLTNQILDGESDTDSVFIRDVLSVLESYYGKDKVLNFWGEESQVNPMYMATLIANIEEPYAKVLRFMTKNYLLFDSIEEEFE